MNEPFSDVSPVTFARESFRAFCMGYMSADFLAHMAPCSGFADLFRVDI